MRRSGVQIPEAALEFCLWGRGSPIVFTQGTAVLSLLMLQPFDPYSVQLIDDPYRIYSRLRREDPAHYSPVFDGWVLSRHADIEEALRDHALYSSASGVELGEPLFGPGDFIVHDPPQHDLLRRQVHRPYA